MKRVPVDSSNIQSVGYDRTHALLEIEFTRGVVYQYSGVPDTLVAQLFSAPSPGGFFHRFIRDKFETKLVSG